MKRVVGAAAVTVAAALPLLAPATIHAEDEATILGSFLHGCEDTPLDDGVVARGEIVHTTRAASGWAVQVTITNPTDSRKNARASVVLQRSFFNPVGRVSSSPADAWAAAVAVELAPHASVTRVFALPAPIGAEMDSSNTLAHAKSLAVERARARGEEPPAWAWGIEGAPRRSFAVALRVLCDRRDCVHADAR